MQPLGCTIPNYKVLYDLKSFLHVSLPRLVDMCKLPAFNSAPLKALKRAAQSI